MRKIKVEPAIRLALQVPQKWSDEDLIKWSKRSENIASLVGS